MKLQTFDGSLPTNNGDFLRSNLIIKKKRKSLSQVKRVAASGGWKRNVNGTGAQGHLRSWKWPIF